LRANSMAGSMPPASGSWGSGASDSARPRGKSANSTPRSPQLDVEPLATVVPRIVRSNRCHSLRRDAGPDRDRRSKRPAWHDRGARRAGASRLTKCAAPVAAVCGCIGWPHRRRRFFRHRRASFPREWLKSVGASSDAAVSRFWFGHVRSRKRLRAQIRAIIFE
jgi:hypothetical protein